MKLLRAILLKIGLTGRPNGHKYMQMDELYGIVNQLSGQEQQPQDDIYQDFLEIALARRARIAEQWADWQSLSLREQEVTALICLGYTNTQIAYKLGISPTTIKTHVRSILSKFRLHSKGELRLALTEWDFEDWDCPH